MTMIKVTKPEKENQLHVYFIYLGFFMQCSMISKFTLTGRRYIIACCAKNVCVKFNILERRLKMYDIKVTV